MECSGFSAAGVCVWPSWALTCGAAGVEMHMKRYRNEKKTKKTTLSDQNPASYVLTETRACFFWQPRESLCDWKSRKSLLDKWHFDFKSFCGCSPSDSRCHLDRLDTSWCEVNWSTALPASCFCWTGQSCVINCMNRRLNWTCFLWADDGTDISLVITAGILTQTLMFSNPNQLAIVSNPTRAQAQCWDNREMEKIHRKQTWRFVGGFVGTCFADPCSGVWVGLRAEARADDSGFVGGCWWNSNCVQC